VLCLATCLLKLLEVLAAQETSVQNGDGRFFPVLVTFARVRGARDVTIQWPPSNVQLHVQSQAAIAIENPATKVTRDLQSLVVHLAVLLQLPSGSENEIALAKSALDFARN
jgi:hypothetical protein